MKELKLLLTFSLSILFLTIYLTIKFPEQKNIIVRIDANNEDIHTLDDARNLKLVTLQYFPSIDFPPYEYLRHSSSRPLGFQKNFFLNLQANFEVIKEQEYEILVKSDDGFRLYIDDIKVSEFISDRPANQNNLIIPLKAGRHKLILDYFQGFGNAGLQVKYKGIKDNKFIPIGVDSSNIKFFPFD